MTWASLLWVGFSVSWRCLGHPVATPRLQPGECEPQPLCLQVCLCVPDPAAHSLLPLLPGCLGVLFRALMCGPDQLWAGLRGGWRGWKDVHSAALFRGSGWDRCLLLCSSPWLESWQAGGGAVGAASLPAASSQHPSHWQSGPSAIMEPDQEGP